MHPRIFVYSSTIVPESATCVQIFCNGAEFLSKLLQARRAFFRARATIFLFSRFFISFPVCIQRRCCIFEEFWPLWVTFAPIFPVSYQVARVNFSKIPKSCKILTSFYCNHAFNVISMAPRGGTLNGADKLFPAVEAAYRRTVDALRAYPAQQR